LLGAAYMFTRNLWFPIAIHFAWNFTQSAIFGASTSGNIIGNSVMVSKITGNPLITGGGFGPEGSLQATLFCLAATIILMIRNHRQRKIIAPQWAKKNLVPLPATSA
jgi:membrane protease YdiL (CAAX protease family)